MINDEEIDRALMPNITDKWRKVAQVVVTAMIQLDNDERAGINDIF